MKARQAKTSLQGVYYKWPKDLMEVDKKRFAGDTIRSANSHEVLGQKASADEFFMKFRVAFTNVDFTAD